MCSREGPFSTGKGINNLQCIGWAGVTMQHGNIPA